MIKNNSKAIINAIEMGVQKWLEESSELILSKTKENTAVDSGKTRDGWVKIVSPEEYTAVVGNFLENSVWEEFGTGEYALLGNGRKGGWVYKSKDGKFYFTKGKQPKRAFQKAFSGNREQAMLLAKKIFTDMK